MIGVEASGGFLTFVTGWGQHTWQMVLEASPWLVGGFLIAGVVYVLLPVERVTRHLGKPGMGGVIKASLLGIPLPLCSCSVIPVASTIRRQGASRGAFVSFLISTPETGVDSMAISYALLGPWLAIARPIAAFVTAITAGLLVECVGSRGVSSARSDAVHEDSQGVSGCDAACGSDTRSMRGGKLAAALRHGLVEQFADLAPWLLAGFALAGLITAMVPAGFLDQHIGSGLAPMLLMLVFGLPMYVCATSSTPIAAALIAHGLSPGAAMVFLLVGPATNVATMLIVARGLGRRGLAAYLLSIAAVALLVGWVVDRLVPVVGMDAGGLDIGKRLHDSAFHWMAAAAFVVLMLNGLRVRLGVRLAFRNTPEVARS